MDWLFGRATAPALTWATLGRAMALLWAVALLTPFVAAHPHSPPANQTRASTFPVRRALANGVALRILPLGDSITYGFGSSDGNGYRQHLRSKLSAGGNAATFVGSQISGSMSNGNNEGHNGATIQQISAFFHSAGGLASRPNVVLLMAGTNDMNRPVEPSTAPDRLDTVISQIVQSAGGDNPVPLIVVAKIPPNSNPSANSRTVTYNAAVEEIVQANQGRGRRVVLADMYSALHVGADMGDGLHPNDGGYAKVADVWYNALADAAERGWIEKPAPAPAGTGRPCTGILSWDPRYGQAASGVGSGDSNKFPTGKWWNRGTVHKGHGENLDGFVHIADLNGDGKDDYIWVDGKSGATALYLNTGDFANWNAVGRVASGVGAGKGVRFADIDGDGKADYLWIDNVDGVGSVRYYRNGGRAGDGKWIWYDEGIIFTGENIIFADIDGDGRADIAVRGAYGKLEGHLNVGPGTKPKYRLMGDIASGDGDDASPRIELRDLNGDGRADYLNVKKDGSIQAYINMLSEVVGADPLWVPIGAVAGGVASRDRVVFGDLDGDGKTDYIVVDPDSGAITLWQNQGSGSTYRAGQNIYLADLNGDGKDDYLIVSPAGAIEAYMNGGASGIKWIWVPNQAEVASGVAKRANIRFGDLDGDGRADYLVVDPETSAVRFWQNGGPLSGGKWLWIDRGVVAGGAGLGPGKGVRFADLNGDGKVDFIYLHRDGKATAFLNGGACAACDGGWLWLPQGQVADGVGVRREDIQLADIDGDGKADYLVVDPLNGNVMMYRNGGPGGSKWIWYPVKKAIASDLGYNGYAVRFADLNGDGRAEYLGLSMASGALQMWANACSNDLNGGGGGPNGPILVSPVGGEWEEIQCTHPVIIDAGIAPDTRWNGVLAWQAWDAAVENWKADHNGLSFSAEMSNFFHGPEGMQCGETSDHNGCTAPIQCHDVNHPAGYMILNSLMTLNNIIMNVYDAIDRTQVTIAGTASSIQKTFAAFPDTDNTFNLMMDIIGLTFAVGGAPVWGKVLRKIPYFASRPGTFDTLKDSVNGLVNGAITIIKDTKKPPTPADLTDALEQGIAATATAWYQSIDQLNEKLFDGSDESIALLDSMFSDGKLLQNAYEKVDDPEIQFIMSRALYATLIPMAWQLSPVERGVVIIDAGVPCGTIDPLDEKDVSEATSNAAWVCHRDRMFFFLAAAGAERKCISTGGPVPHWDCIKSQFSLPQGLDTMDGNQWSGVTKEDLVIGALNTFEARASKNGGTPGQVNVDNKLIDDIQDMDIRAPGIVHIPVCTIAEARRNWEDIFDGSPPSANYPCN